MRKAIFLFFLLLSIGLGYLPARHDDWGLKIVMMALGALFGGAIGGGLSQIGKPRAQSKARHWRTEDEIEPRPGSGMTGREIASNYPRDRGLPAGSRMPDAEPGEHMFDPDKII